MLSPGSPAAFKSLLASTLAVCLFTTGLPGYGQDEPASKKKAKQKTQARLDAIESKLDRLATDVQALASQISGASSPADEEKAATTAPSSEADEVPKLELQSAWLEQMPWRSIGPANMGGRITDLAVHDQDSSLWWIATASGGLLKTNNQGTTVEHQFDSESSVSIGAIATDPSNKDIVWVGTGEINPRNSVSYGDGVYKSTDGGKTWKNMGLEQSYQISRILVHPQDSNVVYVGAQGRLYGTNEQRGVFKTTDGGQSWKKVLYLDERTGVIDMIMHPEDPDTLIVAMWDRLRDGFDSWPGDVEKPEGIDGYDPIRKWGPKAGLYKTTDGGEEWKKLTTGLPTGMTGRIGLDWQSQSPHTIYAIIDCEDIGKGPKPFTAFLGLVGVDHDGQAVIAQVMPESPAAEAGVEVGDVLTSVEGQELAQFDDLLVALREKKPGQRIDFKVARGKKSQDFSVKLGARPGSRNTPTVFIGVTGEDKEDQIVLTRITENGPAANAGLESGDIVLKADGESLESYQAWISQIQQKAIGDKTKLSIQRGEESLEVEVELAARRGTQGRSSAYMGIQGENAKEGQGALLTVITPEGPSAEAGLKTGDTVVKVGDNEIKSYDDLIAEIRSRQPDDKMPVEVRRGKKTKKLEVVLGDRNAGGNADRPYTYSYYGQLPNVQDQQGTEGYQYGGVYKSTDAGETWQRVNSLNVRPMYFSVVRVDPSDDQRVYLLGVSQFQSDNGGVTFTPDFGRGVHSDSHDLWIDPADGRHMVIGGDGGFYVTFDRGQNWDHVNTAAIAQFYHVTIAPTQPYRVYGGLQDNGSWGGPAISRFGGAVNQDWINVGGGDGFVCRVDPTDPDLVYSESQNGSIRRRNLRTGEGASIRPPRVEGKSYRFNWNTPFILSNHNSKVFYSAGNYVFRSLDRGNNLKIISPEITKSDRGSATALSESPRDSNVLYVGTDDGGLWVTRNGGQEWTDISENLGVDPTWVATIEASRYAPGRVYVCLDAHRADDDRPYAFVSEDYGATFTELTGDLPRGSSRCLREDVANPNLLYLGTEFALWVSADRGQTWTQFNQTLPTVAVHEVAMHPDIDEIVAATHGRSLWACDVSGLRELDAQALDAKATLLEPADVIRWRRIASRGRTNRRYVGTNPTSAARLWYTLPEKADEVELLVQNVAGDTLSKLKGKTETGLHVLTWNLTQTENLGRGNRPRSVPNGSYRVELLVNGKSAGVQTVTVEGDPGLSNDALSELEFEAVEAELAETEEEEEQQVGPSQTRTDN